MTDAVPTTPNDTRERLMDAVGTAASKFFKTQDLYLTAEEVLEAFVSPEDRDVLVRHAALTGHRYASGVVKKVSVKREFESLHGDTFETELPLSMWRGAKMDFLLPTYASRGVRPDCAVNVSEKIYGWIDERVRVGLMFGAIRSAVEYMAQRSTPAEAGVFLLPCLPTLYKMASRIEGDKLDKKSKSLAKITRPKSMPAIDKTIRDKIYEAGAMFNTLATTLDSLPDEQPVPADCAVRVSLDPYNGVYQHDVRTHHAAGSASPYMGVYIM